MIIKCRYCNKKIGIKGFSHHLKMLHKIKFINYVAQNLNDFPNYNPCPICETITGGTTCSRKCLAELKKTWTGEKSPHYGHPHSDKTKAKISKIRKKQGNFKLGFQFSEESKKKMSDTRKRLKLSQGKNNGMYGKTHTLEAIKKIMSKRPMNNLEKLVADLLTKHNIKYYYQFFLNRDGICKSYDFKLKGTNIILEIDGDYWHGGPKAKKYTPFFKLEETKQNDAFKNEFAKKHGFEIHRFWQSEIEKNPKILLEKINVQNT